MLTRFAYIIHCITPSQIENERDLLLAGIYTELHRANISVEMISGLIFININITALGHNTPISVFGVSLETVAYILNEMDSNPYEFVYASDTE